MAKTRSKIRIPATVLNLPEGMEATGANVDGDRLEITATPAGNDLSGSVVKMRHGGYEWMRVEYVDAPEPAEEEESE